MDIRDKSPIPVTLPLTAPGTTPGFQRPGGAGVTVRSGLRLFVLGRLFLLSSGVLFCAEKALAHPGHTHFPGVANHLPFEGPESAGSAMVIAAIGLCVGVSFIELAIIFVSLFQKLRSAYKLSGWSSLQRLRTLVASLFSMFLLFALLAQASCSGGGGGEGGGGGSNKRPGSPAVRILHGGIDFEPVRLNSPNGQSTTASFVGENAPYVSFPVGPQTLILERNNFPGSIVSNLPAEIERGTFYSVLLSGEVNLDNFAPVLIPEPDERAGKGNARVQLIHAVSGVRGIILQGSGFTLGPVSFRASSGYAEGPSGPQTFSIKSTDGRDFGPLSLDLGDRGQVTVLVAGSAADGVVVKRVYNDYGA